MVQYLGGAPGGVVAAIKQKGLAVLSDVPVLHRTDAAEKANKSAINKSSQLKRNLIIYYKHAC